MVEQKLMLSVHSNLPSTTDTDKCIGVMLPQEAHSDNNKFAVSGLGWEWDIHQ